MWKTVVRSIYYTSIYKKPFFSGTKITRNYCSPTLTLAITKISFLTYILIFLQFHYAFTISLTNFLTSTLLPTCTQGRRFSFNQGWEKVSTLVPIREYLSSTLCTKNPKARGGQLDSREQPVLCNCPPLRPQTTLLQGAPLSSPSSAFSPLQTASP